VPDTTLRNTLCTLEPEQRRRPLHAMVRRAQRRKSLEPDTLPLGVVSLDGKAFSLGARPTEQADAHSEDRERGGRVVRRLYPGEVTVELDGWEHLPTVMRVRSETFNALRRR
jgi:hypothetical protein